MLPLVDILIANETEAADLINSPSITRSTAANRAVIAGSLAVTRPGAQPSLPRREEVDVVVERGA